jgi:hypothetical protein
MQRYFNSGFFIAKPSIQVVLSHIALFDPDGTALGNIPWLPIVGCQKNVTTNTHHG